MKSKGRQHRYFIRAGDSLDPITIYTEDCPPSKLSSGNQGMITIVCYGEAWSASFGGIGDRNILEFVNSCDEHYLSGKLCNGLSDTETDYDKLTEGTGIDVTNPYELGLAMPELEQHLDSGWQMDMPEKPNPKYQYLMRIVLAVKKHFAEQAVAA